MNGPNPALKCYSEGRTCARCMDVADRRPRASASACLTSHFTRHSNNQSTTCIHVGALTVLLPQSRARFVRWVIVPRWVDATGEAFVNNRIVDTRVHARSKNWHSARRGGSGPPRHLNALQPRSRTSS